jgi:excisionase family DNA binding protein
MNTDNTIWVDESISEDLNTHFKQKRNLRVDEVADYLGIDRRSVRNLIHFGELIAVKCRHQWRVSRASLERYCQENSNMNMS